MAGSTWRTASASSDQVFPVGDVTQQGRVIVEHEEMINKVLCTALVALSTLAGCEQLGIPDPAKEAAAAIEEGKAIGAACRHSGRALEDCYALNPGAHKAAIFEGWRAMNDYMTENKLEVVPPTLPPTTMTLPTRHAAPDEQAETASTEGNGAEQSGEKDGAASERRSTLRTRRDAAH